MRRTETSVEETVAMRDSVGSVTGVMCLLLFYMPCRRVRKVDCVKKPSRTALRRACFYCSHQEETCESAGLTLQVRESWNRMQRKEDILLLEPYMDYELSSIDSF